MPKPKQPPSPPPPPAWKPLPFPDWVKTFGDALRAILIQRTIRQRDAAEMAGINQGEYSKLVRGYSPNRETYDALLKAFPELVSAPKPEEIRLKHQRTNLPPRQLEEAPQTPPPVVTSAPPAPYVPSPLPPAPPPPPPPPAQAAQGGPSLGELANLYAQALDQVMAAQRLVDEAMAAAARADENRKQAQEKAAELLERMKAAAGVKG